MKKAFTLIELLVVIGILGLLVAISLVAMSGTSEAAMTVQCETNLRNLAAACQTYGMTSECYPLAGSVEKMDVNSVKSGGSRRIVTTYNELPGWISWNSQGAYPSDNLPRNHKSSAGWFVSAYHNYKDQKTRFYCLTNGALWKYVSENAEVYRCPIHVKKFPNNPPAWSYVMNSYFGWDDSEGSKAKTQTYSGRGYGGKFSIKDSSGTTRTFSADRCLLFAEIPFMGVERDADTSDGSGIQNDCTLQYKENEVIGFNHSSNKRQKFALVVFADAHTERISWPKDGLPDQNLKDLTKWLCEGYDISFNGSKYEELK